MELEQEPEPEPEPESRQPVSLVVLLGARPKAEETSDGGLPRELTNVSGKSVLSWLLGSLKVRTDAPAALRVSAAASLLSAAVRRALTDAEQRPHLHRAPRRDRQVRGLPHGAPLVPGRPEAASVSRRRWCCAGGGGLPVAGGCEPGAAARRYARRGGDCAGAAAAHGGRGAHTPPASPSARTGTGLAELTDRARARRTSPGRC